VSVHQQNNLLCGQGLDEVSLLSMVHLQNARFAENSNAVHVRLNDDPHISDSFPVINPTLTHDFLESPTKFLSVGSDQHNIANDGLTEPTHTVTGGDADAQSLNSVTTSDVSKGSMFCTPTGEGAVLLSLLQQLVVLPGEKDMRVELPLVESQNVAELNDDTNKPESNTSDTSADIAAKNQKRRLEDNQCHGKRSHKHSNKHHKKDRHMVPRLRNQPKESIIIPLPWSNAVCAGCCLLTSYAYQ
jgi:hypothetical protein